MANPFDPFDTRHTSWQTSGQVCITAEVTDPGTGGGGGGGGDTPGCEVDADCAPGEVCEGGQCVPADGGGGPSGGLGLPSAAIAALERAGVLDALRRLGLFGGGESGSAPHYRARQTAVASDIVDLRFNGEPGPFPTGEVGLLEVVVSVDRTDPDAMPHVTVSASAGGVGPERAVGVVYRSGDTVRVNIPDYEIPDHDFEVCASVTEQGF